MAAQTVKALQRRLLTTLTSKGGMIVLAVLVAWCIIASFQVTVTHQALQREVTSCHGSADNIAGRRFDSHVCYGDIDIVYTWVNGSDPVWLAQLHQYKLAAGLIKPPAAAGAASSAADSSSGVSVGAVAAANATAAAAAARNTTTGATSGTPGSTGTNNAANAQPDDPSSANRFRDNEELRYSLRSIEKYAPWVHHIYLVTNGQVPYWLKLDHPRMTVVSHASIFPNASHLPVFSSPAIEAHLHRIPGLAKKFIYFNDDVFLGSDVWPDDFFTPSTGQKVYLSWDVPKCNQGCLETWIGDGFCDQACNVSACDYDFPDCVNATRPGGANTVANRHAQGNAWNAPHQNCATGCPDSWIGDLTCDKRCDVPECGYDGTDCGLDKMMGLLPGVAPNDLSELVYAGDNVAAFYVVLDRFIPSGAPINSATYMPYPGLRVAVVSEHFRTVSVLFDTKKHPALPSNASLSTEPIIIGRIPFEITYTVNGTQQVLQFTLAVTHPPTLAVPAVSASNVGNASSAGSSTGRKLLSVQLEQWNEADSLDEVDRTSARIATYRMETSPFVDHLMPDAAATTKAAWLAQQESVLAAAVRSSWREAVTAAASLGVQAPPSALSVKEQVTQMLAELPELDAIAPQTSLRGRRLLDTYGSSLVYTNRLIARKFRRIQRKAPAHMPHMIDVDAMNQLQATFPAAFDLTSQHRFRDPQDVQYAFAYFYFLMEGGANAGLDMTEYWQRELDTNLDGVLDDNELRTLAAVVHGDAPPQELISKLKACLAPTSTQKEREVTDAGVQNVVRVTTPHITLERLLACELATTGLSKHARFPSTHQEMPLLEVAFEMITDDFNKTRHQLDSIRARKSKFVCVNDDMKNPTTELQDMLSDFYSSFFPLPSQFELPPGQRNEHLYLQPVSSAHSPRYVMLWFICGCVLGIVAWLVLHRVERKTL